MSDSMSAEEYQAYLRTLQPGKPGGARKSRPAPLAPAGGAVPASDYLALVKQSTPARQLEHLMQVEVVREFRKKYPAYERLLFAIPNGAKLTMRYTAEGEPYSPERIRLVAEGLTAGVLDLMLAVPRQGYHGLFLELKVKPNRPSAEQLDMITRFGSQGYYCSVAYTADLALLVLDDYLALPPWTNVYSAPD
ncbi:VRR-NUC domain-containing protein [Spirosoma sordidisoli]|uniref:VRR-NUC domain-containing protein n=1 Tax=Spirosoma sordidisoli TaxID=2502893 RepID=A0A4Q2UDM5_9BACT|nr:VRR-NUC domain-containing protein [Spirosoma sordidisoli]RYC66332.1 VRR-NUC domain-containing protein [Spirosoma sordidisoli]